MSQHINTFFHFSYLRQDVPQRPQIHELRDSQAFAELGLALCGKGWRYGGLLLNYPQLAPDVPMPRFDSSDLLVLTTRPPLTDDDYDSRPIKRSGTALETQILKAFKQYFRVCRRGRVVLEENVVQQLKSAVRNRGEMEFTLNGPACYKRYRVPYTKNKDEHRYVEQKRETFKTASFLLFTRIPDGPMLLNAFSMDGPGTLIWCYLIRTRFSHLLDSPRFVMAEMTPVGPQLPVPERPPALAFADQWTIEVLADQELS